MQHIYLDVIQHSKIDTTDSPCSHNKGRSMCIDEYVYNKAGCWLGTSDPKKADWKKCEFMEQVEKLAELFDSISMLSPDGVQEETSCKIPCQYKEYRIVGKPRDLDMPNAPKEYQLGFSIVFASSTLSIKEEVYFYPFLTFLGDKDNFISR